MFQKDLVIVIAIMKLMIILQWDSCVQDVDIYKGLISNAKTYSIYKKTD